MKLHDQLECAQEQIKRDLEKIDELNEFVACGSQLGGILVGAATMFLFLRDKRIDLSTITLEDVLDQYAHQRDRSGDDILKIMEDCHEAAQVFCVEMLSEAPSTELTPLDTWLNESFAAVLALLQKASQPHDTDSNKG